MKNHLCYCCLCRKFSIVARTMAAMRHFKAWFPIFQGFSDEFLHGTNYFIKVKKKSQVLKINTIFLFNMYLFAWLRKSNEDIS